ncbi:hypothetical protein DICVIV_12430 [Dictyocaulus viviparus]|uniref:Uncharacterized protein n=1 Tax=Dictyocaulus viviparus TaxID=29172 RepID=A0A0D8XD60_DICVI|nr:hypothetical protein DICVIV_12430 [Dictyocaulus viviparus]
MSAKHSFMSENIASNLREKQISIEEIVKNNNNVVIFAISLLLSDKLPHDNKNTSFFLINTPIETLLLFQRVMMKSLHVFVIVLHIAESFGGGGIFGGGGFFGGGGIFGGGFGGGAQGCCCPCSFSQPGLQPGPQFGPQFGPQPYPCGMQQMHGMQPQQLLCCTCCTSSHSSQQGPVPGLLPGPMPGPITYGPPGASSGCGRNF